MSNKLVETYLQHLKKTGYKEKALNIRERHLCWFVKLFPDQTAWGDFSLAAFLKKRNDLFLKRVGRTHKKSYLHILKKHVEGFLHYWIKGNLIKNHEPLSWWSKRLAEYIRFSICHQGVGKASLWNRQYWLSKFVYWLESNSIMTSKDLSGQEVVIFTAETSRGYSQSTIRNFNATMKSFLRYLFQFQFAKRDLSCMIINPRHYHEQRVPQYLSELHLKTVLDSLDKKTIIGFRDYCVFVLLIQYGLRIHEVVDLCFEDINYETKTLRIRNRKAGEDLFMPLTLTVESLLKRYIHSFRPGFDFPNVFLRTLAPIGPLSRCYASLMISRRFQAAGIDGHAHLIRHTFAKNLIEQGETLDVIQKLLGHRDINSTRIYARVDIKHLREVADNDSIGMVKL